MIRINAAIPLLVIASIVSAISATGQSHRHLHEQLEFSAEDESVKRPIPVPADVLALLEQDDRVKHLLDDESLSLDKAPTSWFSTSVVHLGGPEEIDYIIMGEDHLRGANVVPFWVFMRRRDGLQIVLFTGAHDLSILRRRFKGYKTIEALSVGIQRVDTRRFRFDGEQYKLYRESDEPIR